MPRPASGKARGHQVVTRSVKRRPLEGWLAPNDGARLTTATLLPPRGKVTIGRATTNDVRVTSALTSRYHAAIRAARTCYFVEDLASRFGTFVNGQRVVGARRLKDGDVIKVGELPFVFNMSTPMIQLVPIMDNS